MSYKFIGEDEDTFQIQHPDGSEFSIAKQAIGPGVHKHIKNLEPIKMNDVGEVPDVSDEISENKDKEMRPPAQINSFEDFKNMLAGTDAASQNPVLTQDQNIVPAAQVGPQGPPAPVPIQNPMDQSAINAAQSGALAQKEAAIKQAGAAESGAYQQQSNVWQNLAQEEQKATQEAAAKIAPLEEQNKKLFQGIVDNKVDHNRLYNNMSTGNKILAAIAVAFSGIGQGLQGPGAKNQALEVIQKSIDRDIEDQKLELGKKQSLFSENLRLLGDTKSAALATKAQLLSAAQAKVQGYAAQANSAQAKLQSQMMLSQLELERQKLNQSAVALQIGKNGGNFDPSLLVPRLVPEAHQKAVFEEVQRAQDTRRMGDTILKSFDQAAKENTIARTAAGFLRTPASVLALHQSMQPTFKDLEGTVRQAAMDNTFKNITPSPGDLESTIKTKRAALEDYLKSKASAPTAKGFGIDLDKFGSTATQNQSAPVERQTKDGKIALFNPDTKKFLGYK